MSYQTVYGDLEDYANALKFSKVQAVWFRVTKEQAEIEGERSTPLEDGTISKEKARGLRLSAKITLTALGFLVPEGEQKQMGSSLNVPKPDTQMVFSIPLTEKDCFDKNDVDAYEKDVTAGYQSILKEVEKTHSPAAFFEGVASIIV